MAINKQIIETTLNNLISRVGQNDAISIAMGFINGFGIDDTELETKLGIEPGWCKKHGYIAATTPKIGDILPSGDIVFFVDKLAKYGYAAKPDFEKFASMTFGQAMQLHEFDHNYAVPSREILQLMQPHRDLLNLKDTRSGVGYVNCWSYEAKSDGTAWYHYFGSGQQNSLVMSCKCYVKLVRRFTW